MADINDIWTAIMGLAEAKGVKSIKDLPGCWEVTIDEQWWLAINGHKAPVKCSHGPSVNPFCCYVEFNGWPAASFSPHGGEFAAGSAANEDSFIEACKHASEASRG